MTRITKERAEIFQQSIDSGKLFEFSSIGKELFIRDALLDRADYEAEIARLKEALKQDGYTEILMMRAKIAELETALANETERVLTLIDDERKKARKDGLIGVAKYLRCWLAEQRATRESEIVKVLRKLVAAADGAFSGKYDEVKLEAAIKQGKSLLASPPREAQGVSEAIAWLHVAANKLEAASALAELREQAAKILETQIAFYKVEGRMALVSDRAVVEALETMLAEIRALPLPAVT